MNRQPSIFHNPEVFDPSRWILPSDSYRALAKNMWTYSSGAQSCIGKELSLASRWTLVPCPWAFWSASQSSSSNENGAREHLHRICDNAAERGPNRNKTLGRRRSHVGGAVWSHTCMRGRWTSGKAGTQTTLICACTGGIDTWLKVSPKSYLYTYFVLNPRSMWNISKSSSPLPSPRLDMYHSTLLFSSPHTPSSLHIHNSPPVQKNPNHLPHFLS